MTGWKGAKRPPACVDMAGNTRECPAFGHFRTSDFASISCIPDMSSVVIPLSRSSNASRCERCPWSMSRFAKLELLSWVGCLEFKLAQSSNLVKEVSRLPFIGVGDRILGLVISCHITLISRKAHGNDGEEIYFTKF